MRRALTICGESLIWIIALIIILLSGVVMWIVTGPRAVPGLSTYIEAALAPQGAPYSVNMADTVIAWDGWEHPFDLRVRDIRFLAPSGAAIATFPRLSVRLDIPSLALGQIAISSIRLRHAALHLVKTDDGSINLGFGEHTADSVPVTRLFAGLAGAGESSGSMLVLGSLKSFIIEDTDIDLTDTAGRKILNISNVEIYGRRLPIGIVTVMDTTLNTEGEPTRLRAEWTFLPDAGAYSGKLQFEKLPALLAAEITPPGWGLPLLTMRLDGAVQLKSNPDGSIGLLEFALQGGQGTLEIPDHFEKPLNLTSLKTAGVLANNFQTLVLREAELQFGRISIGAKGMLGLDKEAPIAALHATVDNLPVSDLKYYWPKTLVPDTRQWIVENIYDGRVPHAEAKVNLKPGDWAQPEVPPEVMDATVQIEGATVRYLEGHPEVKGVNALAKFNGKEMNIDLASGHLLSGTTLEKGNVYVANMQLVDVPTRITLQLKAPASDVVHYLALPDLKLAQPLGLDEQKISGEVTGDVSLDFTIFDDVKKQESLGFDAVKYDMKGSLLNVSQEKFLSTLDMQDVSGDMTVNNTAVTFKGKGIANDVSATADLVHDLTGKQSYDTRYTVEGTVEDSEFPRFGYAELPFLSGPMRVKASIEEKDGTQIIHADADLVQAVMNFSDYGWKKDAGVPASLTLMAERKPSQPQIIREFKLSGGGMETTGDAAISPNGQELEAITFNPLRFGKNDAVLRYHALPEGFSLNLSGKRFDISGMLEGKSEESKSLEDLPAMGLTLGLDEVITAENESIHTLKGTLQCDAVRCNAADMEGILPGDKHFSYKIFQDSGQRRVRLIAEDAGVFLRTFGVYDNMQGGRLILNGTFDDSKEDRPLSGKLIITEHELLKAPVLTKLLTVASLTGILNTLSGKGINFKKLSAPFVYAKDVINLKDARSVGAALGITASGPINIKLRKADLDGTVVPSYTLNSMVGNIPIIGAVLTGGEGQGVFAVQYSLKGDLKDPVITINPLSALTPGFLRGFFDIFDSPDEEVMGTKEPGKAKEEKPKSGSYIKPEGKR